MHAPVLHEESLAPLYHGDLYVAHMKASFLATPNTVKTTTASSRCMNKKSMAPNPSTFSGPFDMWHRFLRKVLCSELAVPNGQTSGGCALMQILKISHYKKSQDTHTPYLVPRKVISHCLCVCVCVRVWSISNNNGHGSLRRSSLKSSPWLVEVSPNVGY